MLDKTVKEMKIFIRKYADDLNIDNKKAILQLLKSKVEIIQIKEVSDGIRINLDNLDDNIIMNLYSLTQYKLQEESS